MLVILGWSYHIWIVCITSNQDDQNYDDNNYWNIVEFLLWNWQSVVVNLFENVSLSLFLVGDLSSLFYVIPEHQIRGETRVLLNFG